MFEVFAQDYRITTQQIPLGNQGEDLARCLVIDITDAVNEFGSGGDVSVRNKRHDDELPYICTNVTTITGTGPDGNTHTYIKWALTSVDTAVNGSGFVQASYVVEGVTVKTWVYKYFILPSLGVTGDVPDPYEDVLDEVAALVSEAQTAATNAGISASDAAHSAEQAVIDVAEVIAPMQAQLDEAIAGVTVDSEVINARVDEDGTTYETLGQRLNTEFTDVKNDLSQLIVSMPLAWESGGLYAATGLPYNTSNAIRTAYKSVNSGITLSFYNPNARKFGVFEYDYGQTFIKRSTDITNANRQYKLGDTTAYIRLQISGTSIDTTYAVGFAVANNADSALYNLTNNISGLKKLFFTTGAYINNSSDTVNISSPTNSANYACAVDACIEGDKYYVLGYGATSARLWSFSDSVGNIIEVANTDHNTNGKYMVVVAPEDATNFVCNVRVAYDYMLFKADYYAKDTEAVSFDDSDFINGRIAIAEGHDYVWANNFILTKDFIPHNALAISVQNADIKIAFVKYRNGKVVGFDYWRTYGQTYNFDFDTYDDYKFYGAYQDERIIMDVDSLVDGVLLFLDKNIPVKQSEKETATIKALKDTVIALMANNYELTYANAKQPLSFKSYVGNAQNVHPKVLYFPNKFGEHYYWMAYTPYPYASDGYENPCIAYSDDGYEWHDIEGNPLDNPNGNGYNSDTHLVYRDDTETLECWYRYVGSASQSPREETLYRQTSTDGLTWSEKELIYSNTSVDYAEFLSPAILWDGTDYNIWVVASSNNTIKYYTASGSDPTTLTYVRTINKAWTDGDGLSYKPWHLDVIVDNGEYIALVMCKTLASASEERWTMFMLTSDDNITYGTPYVVIYGDAESWDAYMYRGSIVKVGDEYRIYYSAGSDTYGTTSVWGIGVSISKDLQHFVGSI